ncbi:MAG: hypothetical protein ACE5HS_12490 [bacterium]
MLKNRVQFWLIWFPTSKSQSPKPKHSKQMPMVEIPTTQTGAKNLFGLFVLVLAIYFPKSRDKWNLEPGVWGFRPSMRENDKKSALRFCYFLPVTKEENPNNGRTA